MTRQFIAFTIACLFASQSLFAQSEVQQVLKNKKVIHTYDIWKLVNIKGEDKTQVTINAISYNELHIPDGKLAIQFDLLIESSMVTDPTVQKEQNYFKYIDKKEYAEVKLAVSEIKKNYISRKKSEQFGSINYITQDGINIGFRYTDGQNIAYIEYLLKNGQTVIGEFSNPENFFNTLHEQLDSASKQLYLPENAAKLKNAKKSHQEVKDVIIDDI